MTAVAAPGATRRAYRLVRAAPPPSPPLAEDPVQQRIVAHTAGPLLVIGGPGTGKTATLVAAIAARVREGADPASVLALTFSRRGANALRDRISGSTPGPRAEPLVRTFPAYAYGLLRRAAAEAGEPAPRLLTGPEQDLVIRELLDGADPAQWPENLWPALHTRAFATELRDLLARAVERGVSPADLAAYGSARGRADWAAAARFYAQYLQVLALRDATGRGSVAYDAAELVRAATGILTEDPDLLAAERRRLSYVYVDELADTDPAQVDLLATIAGGGKHLVAFGDPDSSTFVFRGSDPAVVHAFPDRFPVPDGGPAPAVTLGRSHRTGTAIVKAAHRVAVRLRGPSRHRTVAATDEPSTVEVRTFRSAALESAQAPLFPLDPWAALLLASALLLVFEWWTWNRRATV